MFIGKKLFNFQDVFDGRTVKLTDNMDACDKSVTEVFLIFDQRWKN